MGDFWRGWRGLWVVEGREWGWGVEGLGLGLRGEEDRGKERRRRVEEWGRGRRRRMGLGVSRGGDSVAGEGTRVRRDVRRLMRVCIRVSGGRIVTEDGICPRER